MSSLYSFGIGPTKSGIIGASSSFNHRTTSGGLENEENEDFIPLIVVPVLIIVCICCSVLYLLKKYKVCTRRQISQVTSDAPATEITDDRPDNTKRSSNDMDSNATHKIST